MTEPGALLVALVAVTALTGGLLVALVYVWRRLAHAEAVRDALMAHFDKINVRPSKINTGSDLESHP